MTFYFLPNCPGSSHGASAFLALPQNLPHCFSLSHSPFELSGTCQPRMYFNKTQQAWPWMSTTDFPLPSQFSGGCVVTVTPYLDVMLSPYSRNRGASNNFSIKITNSYLYVPNLKEAVLTFIIYILTSLNLGPFHHGSSSKPKAPMFFHLLFSTSPLI